MEGGGSMVFNSKLESGLFFFYLLYSEFYDIQLLRYS
jgi:hypothetical protein